MTRFSISLLPWLVAACGSDVVPPEPDAPACTTTVCGDTCCTAAADCTAGACACPASFVPATPAFVTGVVVDNLPQAPGLYAAIGQFDVGEQRHALLVAYDPATVPLATDIDVASVENVKMGVGYEVDPTKNIRSSYRVTRGTLRLTSACPEGVAGTLDDAELVEIDIFASLDPIPGGCTFALPSLSFALAATCEEPAP